MTKLSNYKNNKEFLIFSLLFIVSVADITSVSIAGGSVRVAWLILPFIFMMVRHYDEEKVSFYLMLSLFVAHFLSAINSGNFFSGALYSIWIVFNYIFFFKPAYALTNSLGSNVWGVFLIIGRLQIVSGLIMFFLGVHDRVQFIYYEPSYFAIGLVPYIFSSFFWSRKKFLDFSLLVLALITSQSASLVIGVSVAALIFVINYKGILSIVAFLLIAFLAGCLSFVIILQNPTNPNYGVVSWIYNNGLGFDLFFEILNRAGNRIPRIIAALDVLRDNWFLGVGPTNYINITKNLDFGYIYDDISYLDPSGLPPVNVIIESAVNAGFIAAFLLIIYGGYIYFRARRFSNDPERCLILGSLCTFLLILLIESSYLRAYVWLSFGVFVSRSRKNIKNEC